MYEELIESVKEDAAYLRGEGFDGLANKFDNIYAALVDLTSKIKQGEQTT